VRRIANWRLGVLVGVTVLEAAVLVIPLLPLALVVAAVAAPNALRCAARFLEALAETPGARCVVIDSTGRTSASVRI
jgi:hypothetical protein